MPPRSNDLPTINLKLGTLLIPDQLERAGKKLPSLMSSDLPFINFFPNKSSLHVPEIYTVTKIESYFIPIPIPIMVG